MDAKKKSSPVGTIIFVVILAALIIGIYLMITRSRKDDTSEIPAELTEAETLIKKDLYSDYPATPREVLKLYCRLTKCLYNDELTDDQIKKLVQQVRLLYSSELLANNSEEDQIALIKGDIAEYRKENKIIYSYTIDTSANSETIDTKAGKTTLIKLYFTLRSGSAMARAYEEFSLYLGSDSRWRIAGWRTTDEQSWGNEG